MKKIAALSCILLCAAAPVPQPKPVEAPKLYEVPMTALQMQVVARALIIASGACGTSDEACQIGLQKTGIVQAMSTAIAADQAKGNGK